MTTITLSNQRIFWTLHLISLVLLLLDFWAYYGGWLHDKDMRELINITLEGNLPTWFSSAQFVAVGVVAWLNRRQRLAMNMPEAAKVWLWIAVFFIYDGIDDTAQIHERTGTAFGHLAKAYAKTSALADNAFHYPSYYWQIVLGPFFVLFGLYMAKFFYKEFSLRLKIIFLSGMACYASKIGIDFVEGATRLEFLSVPLDLSYHETRHLFRAIEDWMKMLGSTMLLGAFMEHLRMLTEQSATAIEIRLRA
ncbi:MAG: hypothetical protein HQL66_07805 [Magnetococcales bacterium]|nr:hypothetical protein [Magnetococcales bacterium]